MIPKFRAWNKSWKFMAKKTTSIVYLDEEILSINFILKTSDGIEHNDIWEDYGDEVEIMQRTGLFDKSGKEIYEGDIVVYKSKHNPDDIKCVEFNKTEIEPFCGCSSDYYIESELREIIGNTYENPELLSY